MCRTATFILLIALGLLGCDDVFNSDREVASEEFSLEQEVADQTRLVLEAVNGGDLFIPVNTSASFSAVVGNGSIDVSNLELQNLVMTSKTVMGVLGEGNGTITLQIANGRITASSF